MSFLSKLFSKQKGGSLVGNLLRGVSKSIPLIGGSLGNGGNMVITDDGKTAAQVAGVSVGGYNSAVGAGQNPIADKMAAQAATPQAIMANSTAGMPTVSSVYPNGAEATNLNDVTISSPRIQQLPQNTNFDLDWKNGRVSTSTSQGADNKMLLYGLLGLGAIMVLNKK